MEATLIPGLDLNTRDACGHPLRDGPCQMDAGHKGRHTTVAFRCELCDKTRRGNWRDNKRNVYGYDHEVIETFAVCWFCTQGLSK